MDRITREPIDMAALARAVEDPGAGAIATFAGTTRNETDGREVTGLTYEAYEEMATAELARVEERARAEHDVLRVAIVHRLGELGIGEISVGIAVSAAHRPAAFDACRFAIEEIKHEVPIWKRERFADGTSVWVHPGTC